MSRFLWLLALLAGCAVHPQSTGRQSSAWLYYPLLHPASYGRSLGSEQVVEGQFKEKHFRLHVFLQIEAQEMLVMGFTGLRTRAFVIRYDGQRLTFENFTNRAMPFPAAMILSDIQQVVWPLLPERGHWSIMDAPPGKTRQVFFDGQLVTRIRYNGSFSAAGEAVLANLKYGYQLRIRTLNAQP